MDWVRVLLIPNNPTQSPSHNGISMEPPPLHPWYRSNEHEMSCLRILDEIQGRVDALKVTISLGLMDRERILFTIIIINLDLGMN